MGQVNHQHARDAAIYRRWVDGASQDDLAGQYGVTQPAISLAISRHASTLPEPDRAAEIRRALDLIHGLEAVYVPKAMAGSITATREVRGLLALRGRYLGIDRREVHVEHGGTVDHVYRPGPTVAEVLEDFRRRGMLHATATRMDQDHVPDA